MKIFNLIKDKDNIPITEVKNKCGKVLISFQRYVTDIDEINLTGAMLNNCRMEGLVCAFTNFTNADLSNSDLYMAFALEAIFVNTNLTNCIFRGSNLTDANFEGANLFNADFSSDAMGGTTRIQGANFKGAKMQGINLTDAEYDSETIFPVGFNPMSHNMIYKGRE